MPIARVQLPDGRVARVEVPEGTTPQQALAFAKQAAGAEATPKAKRSFWGDVADIATNAGAATVNALGAIPDTLMEGTAAVERGITAGIGAVGGAGLRAVGMDGAANALARGVHAADSQLARPMTVRRAVDAVAPVKPGYETSRMVTELGVGAMVPFGPKGNVPMRLPGNVPQTARQARVALGNAAARQDVTMMPADVGGTVTRMATGVARRTLGEIPIAEGAQKSVQTAAHARDRVAATIGRVADETGAGQAAQRGAKRFVASSKERAGQLYEAISVPAKAAAETGQTRASLAEIVKGFDSNPELSAIWTGHPRLKATLDALTPSELTKTVGPEGYPKFQKQVGTGTFEGGGASWEDMKRLRTIVGEIAGDPGLAADGASKAAMRKFYGALSQDMEATAAASGPRALTEFRRATQYWRGRESRIENVLSGILGNDLQKGETAAFEQINRWAAKQGGDFKRLSQAIRSMPEDEAGTIRATVVSRMGQASPGRQNPDGLEFSPAEFATQWNRMSGRAKSALFPDAGHRGDLRDLALITDGMKRAGQYTNTSNTSLGTNAAAHAAGMFASPIITTVLAGGEFALGKLLASPGFARWLVKAPKSASPGAQRHTMRALESLAAKETPIVASEIARLMTHLNDNVPLRASAGESPEQQQQQQAAPQP